MIANNWKSKLRRIRSLITNIEAAISITCMVLMCVFILAAVVMRFILRIPFPWGEEASRYLMIITVMIGVAIGVKERVHLGVTFVTNAVPRAVGQIMQFIKSLIVIGVFALLAWLAFRFTALNFQFGQSSPALNIPMFIMSAVMVFGFSLSCLDSILNFIEDFFIKEADSKLTNGGSSK